MRLTVITNNEIGIIIIYHNKCYVNVVPVSQNILWYCPHPSCVGGGGDEPVR